jgi:predicted O-methyltransferase YrrM
MIDRQFLDGAASLHHPRMGTEAMAPLLYDLVRFVRPRRCLEIGMGYTSLFLLRALADNFADDRMGEAAVRAKASLLGLADDLPGIEQLRGMARVPKDARLAWLEAEPALADPCHYDAPEPGLLIAVDDLSSDNTGAALVRRVAAEQGLDAHLQLQHGDFRGLSAQLSEAHGDFDFIWFDCGGFYEYRDFFDEYWPVVSSQGGLLLMHYTLTNTSMGHVRQQIELRIARGELGAVELISLREPHKMMQNSVTILRKVGAFRDRIYTEVRDISLERD